MTLIGHALVGVCVHRALRRGVWSRWKLSPKVFFFSCLFLPMLPDADTLMHFWVDYGHPLGHRGVFHSFAFALVVGFLLTILFRRFKYLDKTQGLWKLALILSALQFSHGLADTLTSGGKAPRIFWPIIEEGVFAPWRPIPVSPMGKSLLRTQWSTKQLQKASAYRERFLKRDNKALWIPQAIVSLSSRPDHVRRLILLGVILTEILYLCPFLLLFWFWDRRLGRTHLLPVSSTSPAPEFARALPKTRAFFWSCAGLVVLFGLILAVQSLNMKNSGYDFSLSQKTLSDTFETPYLHVEPENGENKPVAVLLHGWRCSKQMMQPLAKMLGRHGIESFALDFPGHGDSSQVLDLSCSPERLQRRGVPCRQPYDFTSMAKSMLTALFETHGLASREVMLIGHSAGAIAAYDIEGPLFRALRGRIALEGRIKNVRPHGNRMVIGGARYFSRFFSGQEHMDTGAAQLGTAYRHLSVPIAHLDLLHEDKVNAGILNWFKETTAYQSAYLPAEKYQALLYRACLWILFFAALSGALFSRLASRCNLRALHGLCTTPFLWRFLWLILGAYGASLMTGELGQDGATWLRNTYYLCAPTYLFAAALWLGVPFVFFERQIFKEESQDMVKAFFVAMLVFILVYAAFRFGLYDSFLHTKLNWLRMGRFVFWSALFVPVTLFIASFQGPSAWRLHAPLSMLTRIGCAFVFLWIYALGCRGSRGEEVLSLMAAVLLVELFASVPMVLWRNRWVYAFGLALTWSWLLNALYPYVTATSV